jgi:hypothetical protein
LKGTCILPSDYEVDFSEMIQQFHISFEGQIPSRKRAVKRVNEKDDAEQAEKALERAKKRVEVEAEQLAEATKKEDGFVIKVKKGDPFCWKLLVYKIGKKCSLQSTLDSKSVVQFFFFFW